MEMLSAIMIIAGAIFWIIGSIMLLVAAFRVSILWFLFLLLCPLRGIAEILFCIYHFEESKSSLKFLFFIGLPLMLLGYLIQAHGVY